MLKTSDRGLKLIEGFEGFVDHVYLDPVKIPTCGWGHVVLPADNLKVGEHITRERAEAFLRSDLVTAEHAVLRHTSLLNQNQFDALVSFVFNVGEGNFMKSTLLKKVNARLWTEAANEFGKWNTAKGKVLLGLTRRREAEKQLFLTLPEVA